MVGKGWHLESQRHSTARRFGSAGGKIPSKIKKGFILGGGGSMQRTYFNVLKKGFNGNLDIEITKTNKNDGYQKGDKFEVNEKDANVILKQIKIKPSKKIKSTTLTDEESNAYDDAMTQYNGNEKKVVKDLEQEFPRLKNYKKWI